MAPDGPHDGSEAQRLFASILDNTRLVAYLKDRTGRYLYVNRRFAELAGLPAADIVGKNDRDLFPPGVAALFREQDAEVEAWGRALEFEETIPLPGGTKTFLTEKFPLKDPGGAVWAVGGFCTETTLQQLRAEESLAAERERAAVILRSIGDGVVSTDTDGVVLTVNPAAEAMLGVEEGQAVGRAVDEVLPFEADDDGVRASRLARQAAGSPGAGGGVRRGRCRGADGEARACRVTSAAVRGRGGGVLGAVLTVHDLSEAEAARQAEERAFDETRAIMKSIPDIFYRLDPQMRLVDWNAELERVSGYAAAELEGKPALEFFGQDAAVVTEGLREAVEKGEAFREARFLTKAGAEIPYFWSGASLRGPDGSLLGVVGVGRDLTDRKREESGRLTIQKLESLGLMAGGIAHDFNNLLTGILGNVSLLEKSEGLSSGDREVVSGTLRAAQRAKNLTLQLLTFAKGGAPQRRAVAVGPLLRDAATFVARGSKVRCEFDIPEGLPALSADEGQLTQVVHNLIINAQQAMPEGGVVTVRASVEEAGRWVQVEVRDRGVGIAEANLEKVFDPYFTTKREGRGLGLATSRSIVEMHGGRITVLSREGEGTTFRVLLPASSAPAAAPPAAPERPHAGSGRLLIMDDEPEVLDVLGRILRRLGYTVDEVEDGARAVAAYRDAMERRPYRAVIMDLTVPGAMGGKEAAALLRTLDPAARLIVSSGYSNDDTLADYALHGFAGSLSKPYSVAEVGRVLAAVLAVSPG